VITLPYHVQFEQSASASLPTEHPNGILAYTLVPVSDFHAVLLLSLAQDYTGRLPLHLLSSVLAARQDACAAFERPCDKIVTDDDKGLVK
jgi:hypothetical protein